ncbi:MAG: hypothetical protein JKY12_02265 [Sneathiella sp.]|nr:hypothetical protein [Sneathiella sp.]
MNSMVIFEIILVLCALVSLVLMRRTYFPMNLFWAVGVVSIGIAALLGAFVYSGFTGLKPYHSLASSYAGSVGITSFAIAAFGGVFSRQFHGAGWWIVLLAISSLSAVLLFDVWRLSEDARYGVVAVLVFASLYRLYSNLSSGVFLFAGTAALVISGLASNWIGTQFGVDPTNIYHGLLSVSVLMFGVFATKE